MTLNSKSVLPPNATDQEKLLADAAWRLNDPPDIASVTDPSSIPADLLPWLAWAMSADVWKSSDPESAKRDLVARSAALHKAKGTVEGFRRLCSLFGATLSGVERPPQRAFCGKSYTQAERDALLEVQPQLRVKERAADGVAVAKGAYCNRSYFGSSSVPVSYLAHTDASAQTMPEVYYSDQGKLTKLPVSVLKTSDGVRFIRASIGATRPYSSYCGSFGQYLAPSDASDRVYSFIPVAGYASGVRRKTLLPGLTPVKVYPDFESEKATKQYSAFAGRHNGGCYIGKYYVPSDAKTHIYKRIYLFSASRSIESHGKSTYLGAVRLGMAPYTAELKVVWPGKRPNYAAGRYCCGFLLHSDMEEYKRFLRALAWAKSARDKVLLDTYSYTPLTAGANHLAGAGLVCGQLIKRF